MPKQIVWSDLAEKDFGNILAYLDAEWDQNVVNQFIDLTEYCIELISINPKQFQLIEKKLLVRKCVITKHNSIFYRETSNRIEILRIYDTRQNPKNLKLRSKR